MPGTVDFLVWSEESKLADPAVKAAVMGGNFGHAAVKITIPQDELNEEDKKILIDSGIPIIETSLYGMKEGKHETIPQYEIYFSFWNAESKNPKATKNRMATVIDDTFREWDGRRQTKKKGVLNRFFSDDDIKEMHSKKRSNIFVIIRHLRIVKKKVFSGVKSIVHMSEDDIHAISNRIKKNALNTYILQQMRLAELNPETRSEYDDNIRNILDHYYNFVNGYWNEKNIPPILDILLKEAKRLSELANTGDKQAKVQVEQLKKDINAINTKLTLGINPDYNISFRTDNTGNGLNSSKMIRAMADVARSKNYKLVGWNCSSTALYVLTQGFDPPKTSMLEQRLAILNRVLDLSKKSAPLITPHQAQRIATRLQSMMIVPTKAQSKKPSHKKKKSKHAVISFLSNRFTKGNKKRSSDKDIPPRPPTTSNKR